MNAFLAQKQRILDNLGVVDYSPKGSIDHEIVPLINLVNSHPELVTTSSCAGRISIFIEGKKSRMGGKGDGGAWLYFTHDVNKVHSGWIHGFHAYEHDECVSGTEPRRYVLFKFEPFILHVKCADLAMAKKLFSAAMSCGFRESGIGSNNVVAVRISLRIDAPIGYLLERRIVPLVTDDYIQTLNDMAVELFAKNQSKIAAFTAKTQELIDERNNLKSFETKEERRERKRQQGLLIQRTTARETDASVEEIDYTPLGPE